MINKFIRITGTGKFLNYCHSSSVPSEQRTSDFEKINLLYGENGSGKTTLSVVLRSLKEDDSLLLKKRAFDKSFPQEIEIKTNITPDPIFKFNNNVWNKHYSDIEIFDIHFINDNIYTGLEIQNLNKKNLFEIILGAQGIKLKEEIQVLKDRIQKGKFIIRDTTKSLELSISNAFTVSRYYSIKPDPAINEKIKAKEAEIKTVKDFQEILKKTSLLELSPIPLPFKIDVVNSYIEKSIDSISAEYLHKVQVHKNSLSMDGKSEDWIKQGFENIKDSTCPFCLRPFDKTVEIIEAYKQYFSDEYLNLINALSKIYVQITEYNLESYLLTVENQISKNNTSLEFWKSYISEIPKLESIIDHLSELDVALNSVKSVILDKTKNPIIKKEISALTSFQSKIEDINKIIELYNKAISDFNLKIIAVKSKNQPNLIKLENELNQLNAIKKRNNAEIVKLCDEYLKYDKGVKDLSSKKDQKQILLDSYSATIFTKYTAGINRYLKSFAPYLQIVDLQGSYVGSSKEPFVRYGLTIDGNEIKFEENSTQPTFKYSLSEGDKNALALSFFLTKLEVDANIQDKILVFDDPVSSFDFNRKAITINKLSELGKNAKQLFILTHNIIFACEFWKEVNQLPVLSQCSRIQFIGNTSCLSKFDIDNETLSSILKDSKAIKRYLSSGCFTDEDRRSIARCLRPALESYFHLKFFDFVKQNDWLGNFISNVRSSSPTGPFYRLLPSVNELEEINDYSKKYHHRFNVSNESEPVTDAELRMYCQKTLDLIQLI